jgi:amino acid adenylation domain-containing protein
MKMTLTATDIVFRTINEVLRQRAAENPEGIAYTFLLDGEEAQQSVTYAQLDLKARAVAARLQTCAQPGERALLLLPPGLEYIVALFACFYSGIIAAPAYPPRPGHGNRNNARIQSIIEDAQPSLALSLDAVIKRAREGVVAYNADQEVRWIAIDGLSEDLHDKWTDPGISGTDLAFLQYTSGSTCAPKGVMVSHSNLLHNERMIQEAFGQSESSTIIGWLPLYHDMGLIGNVLQPLYIGARAILMPSTAFLQKPARWLKAITRYRGTTSGGPNFAYDLCVEKVTASEKEELDLSSWAIAFNGAEPVRRETLERFTKAFEICGFRSSAFYPCYGLAEASLIVTGGQTSEEPVVRRIGEGAEEGAVRKQSGKDGTGVFVGCGRPVVDTRVVIVNPETHEPVGPRALGEIWVSGPAVALGYWGRPEATEKLFRAKLNGAPEEDFLRTQDWGFMDGGALFIAGRLQDLIIIRGQNYHPEDIEWTIRQAGIPVSVGAVAAFSMDEEGAERVVVLIEVDRRGQLDVDKVARSVRRAVAERHQIQVHAIGFVKRMALAKTSSGKIQRHICKQEYLSGDMDLLGHSALAEMSGEIPAAALTREDLIAAPENARGALLEDYLRQRVSHLAQAGEVDVTASLVGLGLDSLMVVQLKVIVETDLAVTLGVESFLDGSSIRDVARYIVELLQKDDAPAVLALRRADRSQSLPLSFAQQRLWFIDQLEPGSALYNVPVALRLEGELDVAALERSLQEIVRRHEALRTSFASAAGEPAQVIAERRKIGLPLTDLSDLPEDQRLRIARRLVAEQARRTFDLSRWPLLRAGLLRVDERDHVLLMVMHHIICDGWSEGVLIHEMAALYEAYSRGEESPLAELEAQYADFAVWQREWLTGDTLERQLTYWTRQLAGMQALDLPTEHSLSALASHRGAAAPFSLSSEVTAQLVALSRREGVTLFMTLLAGFQLLLSRYCGQEDVTVGTDVANRHQAGTEGLIGFFVNQLALRTDLSGDPSFRELVKRVREVTLGAYAHQDLPFERLVEALSPQRDFGRSPLFQVCLVLQSAPQPEPRLGDLSLQRFGVDHIQAKFDVTLIVEESGEGLGGSVEYACDLFEASAISRLIDHLRRVFEQVVANPDEPISRIEYLTPAERGQILQEWNDTFRAFPAELCIHQLFERQVGKTPDAIAVTQAGRSLSYAQLERSANQLAHYLESLGAGPEVRVALYLPRSLELIIALLGILKAGAAYVPIDPTYPEERVAFMLDDAEAAVVLTEEALRANLSGRRSRVVCLDSQWKKIAAYSEARPRSAVEPENLAYVIYTSGTSGKPKGALVTHRGLVNSTNARLNYYREGVRKWLLLPSFAFDSSVAGIFGTLCQGGALSLPAPDLEYDPIRLARLIADERISHLLTVPSLHSELLGLLNPERSSELKVVIVAGEPCPVNLAARHRELAPHVSLFNEYGPTECAVWSTVFDCCSSDLRARIPIGRPIENTRIYILDGGMGVVPVGVAGELYIAGEGVARGYIGQAAQTAERFAPNPHGERAGERAYRTGDKVRYLGDGRIDFLGRVDNQVKVRGYRIELEEIEAALLTYPGVRQAVVVAREDAPGEKRLVGYVAGEAEISAGELREYLRGKLPAYMAPAAYVLLAELPLTPNGKVNRHALPKPEPGASEKDYVAPSDAVETTLVGIFAEALKLERVGIKDNFFELGGHSLLATQVISRVKVAFDVELALRALFEFPTVEELAARLKSVAQQGLAPASPVLRRVNSSQGLPLSFAQRRLWFIDQLEPGSALYNLAGALRLEGHLDVAALERSLQEIVRRHEALRTTFASPAGEPLQVISADWRIALPVIDLSALAPNERMEVAERLAGEEAKQPFILSRGPLLRCELLRLAERDHALVVNMHHIVSDQWSEAILIRDLTTLYEAYSRGEVSPLAEPEAQYADFAVWQKEWLTGPVLEQQLAYWKKQLAGAPVLNLPTDRPRPAEPRHLGATAPFKLSAESTRELKALSQREGVTLFTALMAAFQIVLGRYAGQTDVIIGIPFANRTRRELEGLIGFFVNTLLLRTWWNNQSSVREIVRNAHESLLGAHANQDLPFDRLIEELPRAPGTNSNPLLRVMLIFQNTPTSINIPGLSLSPVKVDSAAPIRTDIDLYASDTDDGLSGHFVYDSEIFNRDTIESIGSGLELFLGNMSRDIDTCFSQIEYPAPAELPRLTSASRNSNGAPLSYHQERIWFIDRFETGVVYSTSPTYHNIPILVRFNGAVDAGLLEQSLNALVARHDALRTRVVETDRGLRQVRRPYGILSLKRESAAETRDAVSEREWLGKLALDQASVPFILDRDLPIRASLITTSDETSILVIALNHIIADRYSGRILLRELAAIYTAERLEAEPELPDTAVTYADYSEWQRSLSDRQLAPVWQYWDRQLSGNLKALELPLDRPRAAVHTFSPGWLGLSFHPADVALIDGMVKPGLTRHSVLLGSFVALLRKYTGHEEIVIGSSDPCRANAEVKDTIGPLANLLVLRNRVSGDRTAISVLQEVAETLAIARANSAMPFDLLVQKLKPRIDMSRTALFDALFQYEDSTDEELTFGQTSGVYVENNLGYGKYDLNVLLQSEADELSGTVVYNTDLLDRSTVERMMRHYQTLVRAVCLNPDVRLDDIALLSEEESNLQLVEWNNTGTTYPESKTIHELFEEQAGKTPDRVAVKCGVVALTYAELNCRANRLARFLRGRGVMRGMMVGVMLDRSADLIVATLGILKAGAAYMPIDPNTPFDRGRFMLNDGRVEHVIANEFQAERLRTVVSHVICFERHQAEIDGYSPTALASASDQADLAYCIYTSGSTGDPNGVMIQHRNVVRLMAPDAAGLKPTADDIWTMFHAYSFDFSVWEMYGALLFGGSVIVVPDAIRKDPNLFADLLIDEGVTVLSQTPSYFYSLVEALLAGEHRTLPVKRIVFGAEVLRPASLKRFRQAYPDTKLINMYGITETTVHVTYHEVSEVDMESSASKIGAPIPTATTYVLDEGLNPVPVRVIGEIYVGGEGMARGYLNRPELTAKRFIPDGISGQCGARLYKTGDLAMYCADGGLEYVGRRDHQVKVRGYRIELGEIEEALSGYEGVRQAVVVAREDGPGDMRLTGYVLAQKAISGRELREYLREKLPEYMTPSAFVMMEEMPLTANGKVDRSALPRPEPGVNEQRYAAPRTAIEEILAGIFARTLKLERVSREERFFDLGGHSLLATQVISQVRVAFEVELALRALFESPTVSGLAKHVESALRQGGASTMPEMRRADRSRSLPLSFAQRRLWFINQLDPESALYNVPAALRLEGYLDVAALERSMQEIVRRHEALRTSFATVAGEPVQVISADWRIAMPRLDLSPLDADLRMEVAERLARSDAERPFDLSRGPLLRCELLRLAEDDHVLVVNMHHIVSDGWSVGVLIRELSALYEAYSRGAGSPLAELEAQYADFAMWQREYLTGVALEEQVGYWRNQLVDLEPLNLPTDHPRPAVSSHRGAAAAFSLSADATSQLTVFSRREGVTPFMTLLAGLQMLLSRYCGQQDVAVGTVVANRNRAETEGLIGFFVNTLVLRTDLGGDPSFRELVKRVREVTLGAYAHQDLPFERLVEELTSQRDLSRSPLFQVCLALQNAPQEELRLGRLKLQRFDTDVRRTVFDVTLLVEESDEGLTGTVQYATDLFEASTIERLIARLRVALERALSNPDESITKIDYLTEGERRQLLEQWNETAREYPRRRRFEELFERQVQRAPEALAVAFEGRFLSYRELNRRANQLANFLRNKGVRAEELIGLCAERSEEMVVEVLGVLKAGCAYAPLDPGYPRERLRFMIEDAGLRIILSRASLVEKIAAPGIEIVRTDSDWELIAEHSSQNPISAGSDESLAYVIYTSGSTGTPKGAMIEQRGMLNHLYAKIEDLQLTERDVIAQTASQSFDISVWQMLAGLLVGGRTEVVGDDTAHDGTKQLEEARKRGITILEVVPSLLAVMLETESRSKRVVGFEGRIRWLLVTGEPVGLIESGWWKRMYPEVRMLNAYGPTECSDDVTHYEIGGMETRSVPIGRAIQNTRLYALDDRMEPVGIGITGELHVGGAGVGRGYLNDAGKTAGKFAPDPYGGEEGGRLYKTGDLVRWSEEGILEYIGRKDEQVKIRGYRIELGEIEEALRGHRLVKQCVALAAEDKSGNKRLVAYFVREAGHEEEGEAELKESLARRRVEEWEEVYDETYDKGGFSQRDPSLNLRVWTSSYTGEPLMEEEIFECIEDTVSRIGLLRPKRALEIGCGTGLLLLRLGKECEYYCGTDISKEAIESLKKRLSNREDEFAEVELMQRAADDLRGIPDESFDVVILNEVTQYFPNIDYLVGVMKESIKKAKRGGAVFVGGVRRLGLLEAFHTSVELERAPGEMSARVLRGQVKKRMAQEKELAIDEEFFVELARRVEVISDVEVQLKGGRSSNELTKYRYDVVLRVKDKEEGGQAVETTPQEEERIKWEGQGVEWIRKVLEEIKPNVVRVEGVPNARVEADLKAVMLLGNGGEEGIATVEDVRSAMRNGNGTRGVEPVEMWELGEERGYATWVSWCAGADLDRYEVLLVKKGIERRKWRGRERVVSRNGGETGWRKYANNPMRKLDSEILARELKGYLAETLPGYMTPSVIIELEELPLTPNGKIDRKALPQSDLEVSERGYIAPRGAVEEILARTFTEVLDLERVGVEDNFFELGGHSLLATQVASRLRESLQIELPVRRLFETPTIAGIARAISQDPQQQERAETAAALLMKLDQFSEEEIDRMLGDHALEI